MEKTLKFSISESKNLEIPVKLIESEVDGEEAIKEILKEDSIAFDCEGSITLVQIGLKNIVYLFDILRCPGLMMKLGRNILENERICKIIHDVRFDRYILKQKFEINLKNVWDTQIAFAFQKNVENALRIGYNSLCKYFKYTGNPDKYEVKVKMGENSRFWTIRPLSDLMISYAAADVIFPFGLKRRLSRRPRLRDESLAAEFKALCEVENYDLDYIQSKTINIKMN